MIYKNFKQNDSSIRPNYEEKENHILKKRNAEQEISIEKTKKWNSDGKLYSKQTQEEILQEQYGVGYQLLFKTGYKIGDGLGKQCQGIKEPIKQYQKHSFCKESKIFEKQDDQMLGFLISKMIQKSLKRFLSDNNDLPFHIQEIDNNQLQSDMKQILYFKDKVLSSKNPFLLNKILDESLLLQLKKYIQNVWNPEYNIFQFIEFIQSLIQIVESEYITQKILNDLVVNKLIQHVNQKEVTCFHKIVSPWIPYIKQCSLFGQLIQDIAYVIKQSFQNWDVLDISVIQNIKVWILETQLNNRYWFEILDNYVIDDLNQTMIIHIKKSQQIKNNIRIIDCVIRWIQILNQEQFMQIFKNFNRLLNQLQSQLSANQITNLDTEDFLLQLNQWKSLSGISFYNKFLKKFEYCL